MWIVLRNGDTISLAVHTGWWFGQIIETLSTLTLRYSLTEDKLDSQNYYLTLIMKFDTAVAGQCELPIMHLLFMLIYVGYAQEELATDHTWEEMCGCDMYIKQ